MTAHSKLDAIGVSCDECASWFPYLPTCNDDTCGCSACECERAEREAASND